MECYRELIDHYEAHKNLVEASAVAEEMVQNNAQVGVEDWRKVLELAIQLPDHSAYWKFRELLRLNSGQVADELAGLLLLHTLNAGTKEWDA